MMTERLKTLTQTTTAKSSKLYSFVAITLLVISIIATFLHRALPSKNPKITELNKERSKLRKDWNEIELKHDSLLANDLISKNDYLRIKKENKKSRFVSFTEIAKKRKIIANKFSFNGRSSKHYWMWIFGFSLFTFIVSCFLAIKDAKLNNEGLLKWYEPYASISFITISLFWLYHAVFMTKLDFIFTTYICFLMIVLFILSYFIYHFLRRSIMIEEGLLQNIRLLVSHILKNTKEEKESEKWDVLDKISKNGR